MSELGDKLCVPPSWAGITLKVSRRCYASPLWTLKKPAYVEYICYLTQVNQLSPRSPQNKLADMEHIYTDKDRRNSLLFPQVLLKWTACGRFVTAKRHFVRRKRKSLQEAQLLALNPEPPFPVTNFRNHTLNLAGNSYGTFDTFVRVFMHHNPSGTGSTVCT